MKTVSYRLRSEIEDIKCRRTLSQDFTCQRLLRLENMSCGRQFHARGQRPLRSFRWRRRWGLNLGMMRELFPTFRARLAFPGCCSWACSCWWTWSPSPSPWPTSSTWRCQVRCSRVSWTLTGPGPGDTSPSSPWPSSSPEESYSGSSTFISSPLSWDSQLAWYVTHVTCHTCDSVTCDMHHVTGLHPKF